MALVTYDDLTGTIAAYLNRTDLDARIPDFIRLAEARMQRELRAFVTRVRSNLPLSPTTGQTPAIAGSGSSTVEMIEVGLQIAEPVALFAPPTPLVQVSLDQLYAWHDARPQTAPPQAYAVIGQGLIVYPFPDVPKDSTGADSSYFLVVTFIGPSASFAVPITALNASGNPILAEHPDLYVYGALAESAPYLRDDERVALWDSRFKAIVRDIGIQHDRLAAGARPFRHMLPVVFG